MLRILKKVLALFLIFACAGALLFSSQEHANASIFGKKKSFETKSYAALSGFKPSTIVSYKILPQGADPIIASSKVDARGDLNIEMPENLNIAGPEIIYDFTFDQQEQALSVLLRINTETGAVSISGHTEDFVDIEITAAGKNIDTRTDWAGLFEETGIQARNEDGIAPVQVAFYSRNIASDAQG